MSTTIFDIVTTMFEVLNVDAVTDLLSGPIQRHERKEGDEGNTSIVINVLDHTSDFVSDGVANVNIYTPTLSNKMNDDTKMDEILNNVVDQIIDYSNAANYMLFEIVGHKLLTDDRDQTYVNLRVNYFCEL